MSRSSVLNLTQLHLDRLPGIGTSFSVTAKPGINLVIGPNEAGKSSLVRSVFELLWPTGSVVTPFSVRGVFSDEVGPLQARREDNDPVAWTRGGDDCASPELPGDHVAHCYRMGLLDLNRRQAGDLDQRLAREIRTQMAGGFDLARVRELFPDQGSLLTRRARQWNQARQELQQCQNQQRALADQERGLDDLAENKARALKASQRADQLIAAQEHLELALRQVDLEARLAELPADMDQVRPGDDENLADLRQRIGEKTQQVQDLQTESQQRSEQMAQLVIKGDVGELALIVKEAEGLAARVQESARGLAAANAAAEDARADLAPELLAADVPAGAEAAFNQLARAHRDLAERQVRVEHLERLLELGLLGDAEAKKSESKKSEVIAQDMQNLLVSGHLVGPNRGLLFTGVAALVSAALMLIYGSTQPVETTWAHRLYGAALVAAVAGANVVGRWVRARRAAGQACRRLEEQCRTAGRPLPAGWTPAEALAGFLTQAQQVGEEKASRQTRDQLRDELQRRLERAHEAVSTAAAHRVELLQALGQDEHRDDPDLLQDLDRVARCRAAENQRESARGAHLHNEAAAAKVVANGQSRLAAMDVPVDATVIGLQAGLERLHQRQTELASLKALQTSDEKNRLQADRELVAAQASREGLLARLAVAPLAAQSGSDQSGSETIDTIGTDIEDRVAVRVAALPRYHDLRQDLQTVERDLARVGERLTAGDDLPPAAEVLGLSRTELAEKLAAEKHLADGAAELGEQVALIKAEIERARRGDTWEKARAEETELAADLDDLLTEQKVGVLGRLLLGSMEKSHQDNTQPPLLTEMNSHLKTFTKGRYCLRVTGGADEEQRFVAVDNTDRRLELAELSDGTRAQLLLAARLAFLTGSEEGLQAPLFLDEALTASDPVRFDDIAGAIGEMAASAGRQVFYLTSDPTDLAAWQRALERRNLPAAHVIDLAAQRSLATTATVAELSLQPLPTVPRPDGMTAAAYGTALQVPALQPWADESQVHLFHLWPDDLELVYRLRVGGLPTLGQWRQQGAVLTRAGMITPEQAARIDARGQVFGVFLDAWRVGRGRPVDRQALVNSETLSPTMLPLACELLVSVNGDGEAFMTGAHTGKIKRLNMAKKEALQEYLERHGHLDRRPTWEPDQIVAHVLGAVSDELTAEILAPDEVRELVLNLHQILSAATARSA